MVTSNTPLTTHGVTAFQTSLGVTGYSLWSVKHRRRVPPERIIIYMVVTHVTDLHKNSTHTYIGFSIALDPESRANAYASTAIPSDHKRRSIASFPSPQTGKVIKDKEDQRMA